MIDSLDGMIVMASDQQKAIEFYTQLGFELKSDTPFGSGNSEDILWVTIQRNICTHYIIAWYALTSQI